MRGRTNNRNSVSQEAVSVSTTDARNGESREIASKWVAQLGFQSNGEPAIADGLIWVGTNNKRPRDGKLAMDASVLMCFRATDGKFLYQYVSPRLTEPQFPSWNQYDWPDSSLSSTPLIEGDRLWFCTNRSEIVCLDIGKFKRGSGSPSIEWKLDMIKECGVVPRGVHMGYHSVHCSVASYRDTILITTGNVGSAKDIDAGAAPGLLCLSKKDGSIRWRANSPGSRIDSAQCGNPMVAEFKTVPQVIVADADEWLRSYSAESGQEIWRFDLNSSAPKKRRQHDLRTLVALPIAYEGRVYFALGNIAELCIGPGMLMCVNPELTGDISEIVTNPDGARVKNANSGLVWTYNGDQSNEDTTLHRTIASPTIHEGLLIISDMWGTIHCVDSTDGRSQWIHSTNSSQITGAALVVDKKIYIGTDDGELLVFRLQRDKSLIGRLIVSMDGIKVTPVFSNGVMYVMSNSSLHAISK